MDSTPPRRGTLALAAVLVAVMAWWPLVLGRRVPLLGWIDLAIHEAGHVLFLWAPHDLMLLMGNGLQAGLPLVVAAAFLVQERDLAGAAVGIAWAGENLLDAAVYAADAPVRRLPLLGPEDSHDWWQLLGGHGWLDAADEVAMALRLGGILLLAAAVAVLVLAARGQPVRLPRRSLPVPPPPGRTGVLDTAVETAPASDVTVTW